MRTHRQPERKIRTAREYPLAGWLFTAPATLGFLLFTVGPMLISLYYSFTSFDGITQPIFVGLANYRRLFDGSDIFFPKAVAATVKYALLGTPVYLLFSLAMALLIHSMKRGRGFFRFSVFLPAVIPMIASCLIWKWLCDPSLGVINNTLKAIGIIPQTKWFYSVESSLPTMVLMWMWGCGTTMIVFLAGLQDVPQELYEAMDVDGGNSRHKLAFITLPMIRPSTMFCGIVSFVTAIQCFVPAYSITNGGPNNSTLFYIFYMYREAFSFRNMGGACAIAWVMFVVLLILTQILSRICGKWVYYGGE